MSRGLEAAALAAVEAEVVTRTTAVELDFSSGFARYCGAPFDLTIDGDTYTGVGGLGSIAAIEEGAELRSYGLVLALTGIPRDVIALALADDYQGRSATVWEVQLDSNNVPIVDPQITFRGRMDQMDVALGATASVTLRLENKLVDWERARVMRYTSEDQQQRYPTDRFFDFVPSVVETNLIWPSQGFIPP